MDKINIRELLDKQDLYLENATPMARQRYREEVKLAERIMDWLYNAIEQQQFSVRRGVYGESANYCLRIRNTSGISFRSFSVKITLFMGNAPIYETWAKVTDWNAGEEGQLTFFAPPESYTRFAINPRDVVYEIAPPEDHRFEAGEDIGWQQGTGTSRPQSTGTPYQKEPTSWALIVLAFIFFWPLGLFLLIRRFGETYATGSDAKQLYEETTPTNKPKKDTFLTIGYILCFIAGFSLFIDVLPKIPYYSFSYYAEDLCYALAFAAGGTALLVYQQKIRSKFRRYDLIINEEEPAVSLDYIKKVYPASYNQVITDLQKMLEWGYFPGAIIDLAGRQLVFPNNGGTVATEPVPDPDRAPEPEPEPVPLALKEQRMASVRECRERVGDAEIGEKLEKLESLIGKIHDRLEERPDQQDKVDRFMNEYLPLVLKAIHTYTDLVEREIPGQEVEDLKRQLEGSLDNFIKAFEKILANLYKEQVVDVSTDITALEGALAGEGLLEDDDMAVGIIADPADQ